MISFTPPPDYALKQLLAEDVTSQRWLASQTAMQRDVVIEVANLGGDAAREIFIATARAKAAVNHPAVASIYEAINDPSGCFFVREWLPGRQLETLVSEKINMSPLRVAALLKRLAEVEIHIQQCGLTQAPLESRHLYLDDDWNLRLSNRVSTDPPNPQQEKTDIISIANALSCLVLRNMPGATRMQTLLNWMQSLQPEHIHTWKQVCDYATQIEQQLLLATNSINPITSANTNLSHKNPRGSRWHYGLAVVAVILVVAVLWMRGHHAPAALPISELEKQPIALAIPAGMYRNPEGSQQHLPAFWLGTHEVTIAEYADFLDDLAKLDPEQRRLFDHPEQPQVKTSHEPDDWSAIWPAAQQSIAWRGRPLQRSCPVFGIDWWDAYAYCDWRRGRLPTVEEWHAALFHQCSEPQKLSPLSWGAVNQLDVHPSGFLGLVSGVSEWTSAPRSNPNNPLGEKQWVIVGSNSLHPQMVSQRRWVMDRSARFDDTGLRVAFDQEP